MNNEEKKIICRMKEEARARGRMQDVELDYNFLIPFIIVFILLILIFLFGLIIGMMI